MEDSSSLNTKLMDLKEPSADFLLAHEKEAESPARRRALAVLISDPGERVDHSVEHVVAELLAEADFSVGEVVQVESEESRIREAIETGVVGGVDLVVTIGATGVSARDNAPEATSAVIDRLVPGVAEAIRAAAIPLQEPAAITSRGLAGISGSTVVLNLAGTKAAVRSGIAVAAPLVHHLIQQL